MLFPKSSTIMGACLLGPPTPTESETWGCAPTIWVLTSPLGNSCLLKSESQCIRPLHHYSIHTFPFVYWLMYPNSISSPIIIYEASTACWSLLRLLLASRWQQREVGCEDKIWKKEKKKRQIWAGLRAGFICHVKVCLFMLTTLPTL